MLWYCGESGERGVILGEDRGVERLGDVLPDGWYQEEFGTFSVATFGLASISEAVGILENSNLFLLSDMGLKRP